MVWLQQYAGRTLNTNFKAHEVCTLQHNRTVLSTVSFNDLKGAIVAQWEVRPSICPERLKKKRSEDSPCPDRDSIQTPQEFRLLPHFLFLSTNVTTTSYSCPRTCNHNMPLACATFPQQSTRCYKLWPVYTQIVPVIFEPPCMSFHVSGLYTRLCSGT